MKTLVFALLDGLRALALRVPRRASLAAGAGLFIALIVVYLAVTCGIALLDTPRPWRFEAGGISIVLADSLLVLVAGWLLVVFARRRDIVWGTAAVVLAATILYAAVIRWPLAHASDALLRNGHALPAVALDLLSRAWWLLVLLALARWLAPRRVTRAIPGALLAYAVSTGAWWWLPQSPLLVTRDAFSGAMADTGESVAPDESSAATDEDSGNQPLPDFDAEQLMFDQPALLDAALAALAPQRPGHSDLYVVTFAGDAGQNVFRNEAEYAQTLFEQRFDAVGHVLVLENNAQTIATRPLATWTNLHHALDAIAKKMDPAEDIVLVYLTTHGSGEHQLLVDLDPLPLDQIEPEDISDALKTTPAIRWKVIVVNACYSGGFIDALRDDSTLVITSARADRTSFGCGADSDITYFGRALLVDALNQTTSLREGFELAKRSVAAWETRDKEDHSEPQMASAPGIEAKLAAWRKQLPADQPAIPFTPAPAAADD